MLTEDEAPQALACLKPREACGLWAECGSGRRRRHRQDPGLPQRRLRRNGQEGVLDCRQRRELPAGLGKEVLSSCQFEREYSGHRWFLLDLVTVAVSECVLVIPDESFPPAPP